VSSFCTSCGEALFPGTRFCGQCGAGSCESRSTNAPVPPATPQRGMVSSQVGTAPPVYVSRTQRPPASPSIHWGVWVAISVLALGWLISATTSNGTTNETSLIVVGLVLVVLGCAIYLLPTIIAFHRMHRSRWMILVLNLAFGATLVGWVIALVWALNKVDDPLKGGMKYDPQPHDPIL
jgi:hypothetical protein